MKINISKEYLPIYSALDSEVRINIIQLLAKNKMNVKELAKALNLSNSIITMHINKLELAGIIITEKLPGKSGIQRVSSLSMDNLEIIFPQKEDTAYLFYEANIPLGQFTDYKVYPTCGMADKNGFIGKLDDPKYFMDSTRINAQIIWFSKGFLEYKATNYLNENETLHGIELSMELSSEFPLTNEDWPSDITFSLNDSELGTWTSSGDFSDRRGENNPDWWPDDINQYGFLKTILINHEGTFIDGNKISNVTIHQFQDNSQNWTIRFEVKPDAKNIGGLTIFGEEFGDFSQNIKLKTYYA